MAEKKINKYIAVLLIFTVAFSVAVPAGIWADPEEDGEDAEKTVPEAVYEEVYTEVRGFMMPASYAPALSNIPDAAAMDMALEAVEEADKSGKFTGLKVGDIGDDWQRVTALQVSARAELEEAIPGLGVNLYAWFDGSDYCIYITKNNWDRNYTVEEISFLEDSNVDALKLLKVAIASANYRDLQVDDLGSQAQKTAAVQAVVDEELWEVDAEAAVTFDGTDYEVAVSMNEESDSLVIPAGAVSFRITDSGVVFTARTAIEAAYEAGAFIDLEVADADDEWQKETAVRLAAEALVPEYGVDIYVYYNSSDKEFDIDIRKNNDGETLSVGVGEEPKLMISFAETDTGAVRMAKEAIKEAEAGGRDEPAFENLQIGDMKSQVQKTAAVQAVINEILADYDVAASVIFDAPNYVVELYKNEANESYNITGASFSLYAPLAVAAAKKAIAAVDYNRLKIHSAIDESKMKAAIEEAANNAAEGLNVDISVEKISGVNGMYDFRIDIYCYNSQEGIDEEDSHTINGIRFAQDDDLALAEVMGAVKTASYAGLPVDDIDCQWKKTASVKAAVDKAVNAVWAMNVEEADIGFNGNDYIASITVGSTSSSCTIPGRSVSFVESNEGTVFAANYFLKTYNFGNIVVNDPRNQEEKTTAVQAAVNSALAAADLKRPGLTVEVTSDGFYYYFYYEIEGYPGRTLGNISPTFIINNQVETVKTAIMNASYISLEVADTGSQDQKTAAVQKKVDSVLRSISGVSNVTAEVEYDESNYVVSIYTDDIFRDSHTIIPDNVSFRVTEGAIIKELEGKIEKAILEADYTDLEIPDIKDQLQKTAAVQAIVEEAVEAVVEGLGFTVETSSYGDQYAAFIEGDEESGLYTGQFIGNVTFIESEAGAVKVAKGIISMASYTDLEVADAVYQEQKTAAVDIVAQNALDRIPALSDVKAAVTFDGTNYKAAISHSGINDIKTIYLATFIESDAGAVKLAKAATESADYNNLEVEDITNQEQKTAAVEAVVIGAVSGLGVNIDVTYTAGYYKVDIFKNAASASCYISKASFVPPAAYALEAAGLAIAAANFKLLAVMDVNNQAQKTAAVQAVVNEALTGFGVTADVTFNETAYEAKVSNGTKEATYTIAAATFVQSNQLNLMAAREAVMAAIYTNLIVGDIKSSEQKTAVVKSTAEAAAAGYGVTVSVVPSGTAYTITLVRNTAQSSCIIGTATFVQSDADAVDCARAAIAAANYKNLPVGDITNQEQKTAAIRSVADTAAAGYGTTVAVAFNGTGYTVTIIKNMSSDSYTITNATFSPTNSYTITTAPAAGGAAAVAVSKTPAYAGDTITVYITGVQDGKRLSSITVNGGAVSVTQVTEGAEYTFTMPEGAVTIAVMLENTPRYVAGITGNNILIAGRHAFNLDTAVQSGLAADRRYNQDNFHEAINNWVHEPQSGTKAIYYRAGNKWYNLTAAEGLGLVSAAEVSANAVNGDGIYYYMNMELMTGANP